MKRLNDLPKDILIQLVTTIEKKTKEKCEKEFYNRAIDLSSFRKCSECGLSYDKNKHKWWCFQSSATFFYVIHCCSNCYKPESFVNYTLCHCSK